MQRAKLYFYPTTISYNGTEFKYKDWIECYPNDEEYVDTDLKPEQKSYSLTITVFKDYSHATCLDTRISFTGILILLGIAPILYYSKYKNTANIYIYVSEPVAIITEIKNLMGMQYKL